MTLCTNFSYIAVNYKMTTLKTNKPFFKQPCSNTGLNAGFSNLDATIPNKLHPVV